MVRYVSPPSGSPASKLAPAPSGGDDLAALQAFVDATNAGDIVTFRGDGAVYLVSGTLALPASRTYRGGGWVSSVGTTIKLMDGANADAVVAAAAWVNDSVTIGQALTIEGLRIDGNAAGQSSGNGDGLVLMNWRSTVERVAVDNARRHGIRLTVLGASGGVVSNQAAENSIARCSVSSAGGHGIFAEDSGGKLTDGWVLDCIVAGAALDGIRVERAAGWKIRGNHVYGTIGNHGIFSQNNFATVITENYVENFGTTDNAGIYNGIFARNCMAGQATTVTDNQIKCLQTGGTNTYEGIKVHAAASNAAPVIVADNFVQMTGSTMYGIKFSVASAGTLLGTVTGNHTAAALAAGVTFTDAGAAALRHRANSWNFGTAAPSGGYWTAGSSVDKTAPTASSTPGWLCTAAGTPGTWVSRASMAAA